MSMIFSPLQICPMSLSHRAVMAPLTRSRSEQPGDVPGQLMREYYAQRASAGGLIISEGTTISISSRGWLGAPGLYTDQQVKGWKQVTYAVHVKGGRMFSQLWHTGRSSHVEMTGGLAPVSASVDPAYWQDAAHLTSTLSGWVPPSPHRALEIPEIAAIVEDYRQAARRAMAAGFDGVELHGANGYLPDQFLQDGSNKRTDRYGGSIKNRARFMLELVDALASVWGAERVGVRISPSGEWGDISDSNPDATFGYLAGKLDAVGLAYLHIIEPRIKGDDTLHEGQDDVAAATLRKFFKGTIIAAGGFTRESAQDIVARGDADLVAFGRHFSSNPDLPERLKHNLPLNHYKRDAFWGGDESGYNDFATYEEQAKAA